jgi:hypothetical protein
MAVYTRNNIVTNGLVFVADASNPISYTSGSLVLSNVINPSISGAIPSIARYDTNIAPSIFFSSSQLATNISSYDTWSVGFVSKIQNIEDLLLGTFLGQNVFFWNSSSNASLALQGYTTFGFGVHFTIGSIITDSSGSIYVGGQFNGYQNIERSFCFKLDSSGSLINDFNIGYNGLYGVFNIGKLELDNEENLYAASTNIYSGEFKANKNTGAILLTNPYDNASVSNTFALDNSTNSMYLSSWSTIYQNSASGYFVKCNKNTYQRDFNFNTYSSGGFNSNAVSTILFDSNQNLFVGGGFTTYQGTTVNRIVKVNKDTATLDTSFNMGVGFNNTVSRIIESHDSKIYAIGTFTSYSGSTQNRIVKLNLNGTIDSSFNIGAGFNSTPNAIAKQSDGKLIVVGDFTSYSGSACNRITRINTDGTRDLSFSIGTGFSQSVATLYIQSDGKILVGAVRGTYNGTSFNNIIRLNSDGTIDPNFNITGSAMQPLYRADLTTYSGTPPTANTMVGVNPNGRIPYSRIYSQFGGFNYYTLTYNQSTGIIYFYINGALRGTTSLTPGTAYPLKLNFLFPSTSTTYLSYLQVYNKELTRQEIFQNYNATKTRFGI